MRNKNTKSILILFSFLVIIGSIFIIKQVIYSKIVVNAVTNDSDYIFSVSKNEVTITGYQGESGIFAPPSTLEGNPVKYIGGTSSGMSNKLTNADKITSIDLSNCSNIEIRQYAFYNSPQIESADLSSCISIGNSAFSQCTKITEINISFCKIINSGAFEECPSLVMPVFPPTLTNIGSCAFNSASSLTGELDLSKTNLNSLGDRAFRRTPISKVKLPATFTRIKGGTFYKCSNLTSVEATGVTYIEDQVAYGGEWMGVFQGCGSLFNIKLGDLTYIGTYAFGGCNKITTISINFCKIINSGAFEGCSSLVMPAFPPTLTNIGSCAFNSASSLTGELDLSKTNLNSLGDRAFRRTPISKVKLPATFTRIKGGTFYKCGNLTSVEATGVTYIEDQVAYGGEWMGAFQGCGSLFNIKLGDLTYIGTYAFGGCNKIMGKLDLSSCQIVGGSAFSGCINIVPVFKAGVLATVRGNAFNGVKYIVLESENLETLKSGCNVSGITEIKRLAKIDGFQPQDFIIDDAWMIDAPEVMTYYPQFEQEQSNTAVDGKKRTIKIMKIDNDGVEANTEFLSTNYPFNVKIPLSSIDNTLTYKIKLSDVYLNTLIENINDTNYVSGGLTSIQIGGTSFEVVGIKYVTSIQINKLPENGQIEYLDTRTLNAQVSPDDAENPSVTWSTSNDSIMSIESDGTIIAKKVGDVQIIASSNDNSGIFASVNLTVTPRLINNGLIEDIVSQEYNGDSRPVPVVKDKKQPDNKEILTENVDYTVNYTNNKNVSTSESINPPTVKITGIGNYNGENFKTFTIYKKNISINVAISNKKYDGLNTAKFAQEPTLEGVVPGDVVNITKGTPTFNQTHIGNNIKINFTDFTISGNAADNYNLIQPSGITASIEVGFVAEKNEHYTLSIPEGSNNWHKSNPFIITAQSGYSISESSGVSDWSRELKYDEDTVELGEEKSFYIRDISTNEISQEKKELYKKDSVPPTGEIKIGENKFNSLLNLITFGLFFKETVNVSIMGADKTSSVSIEYQKVDSQEKYDPNKIYTQYTGSFNISPNEKFIIYGKITDRAGNCVIINSEGVVLYTDSEQSTKEIEYTKTSQSNVDASVSLNGNTVNKILNGTNELNKNVDYTVDSSIITFKHTYLNTLSSGDYIITINYNPMGQEYLEQSLNQAPRTTSINLKIKKSNQTPISIENFGESYVYGDNQFMINIIGGDSNGKVFYFSSNSSVASVDEVTGLVTILSKGDFTITAVKDGDDSYNEIRTYKNSRVYAKGVSISGITSKNKIYDGNVIAEIDKEGTVQILGKISGDKLEIDYKSAVAHFENKCVGEGKRVIFRGFAISGDDADNYILNDQPSTVYANILKKDVLITGISSENKVYDGTQNASISGKSVILGMVPDDDVHPLNGSAHFQDKNVGQDKTVIFSEFSLVGLDSGNYNLALNPEEDTASIIAQDLGINAQIQNKKYDGLNTAKFIDQPTLNNLIIGDDVIIVEGTGIPTFSSIDAAEDIKITFTDFEISGVDCINYNLIQPTDITAAIETGFTAVKGEHYTLSDSALSGGVEGWHNDEFAINSKEGYLVSFNNLDSSSWKNSLNFTDNTNKYGKNVNFYVRNITTKEISISVQENYKLDKTSPYAEIDIGENKFTKFLNNITFKYFFKQTIDVDIAAHDDLSGINTVEYFKSDKSLNENEIKNIDSWISSNHFSVDPDSQFVVYVKAKDKAGNVKYISSDGIVISQTPISIKIDTNFDQGVWQNDQYSKIDVDISNDMPIIQEVSYKIDQDEKIFIEVENKKQVKFTIDSLPDGDYEVAVNATDELGDIKQKIIYVKKDTAVPIVTSIATPSDTFVKNDVEIVVSAIDSFSGLSSEPYSFDGGMTWQESQKHNFSFNIILPENTIKVKDNAGNAFSHDKKIIIDKIDKLIPYTPTIEGCSSSWVNHDVVLTVNAQDHESDDHYAQGGIDYFEYSLDSGKTFNKVNWDITHSFTISDEGDYSNKILVRVADKAGNISSNSNLYSVKVDKTKPEIISVNKSTNEWTNQDIKLTVEAKDNLSQLSKEAFSFDCGATWQNKNYKIYSHNETIPASTIQIRDAAGNICVYNQEIVIDNIDKLAPDVPQIEGASDLWTDQDVILTVKAQDKQNNSQYAKSDISYFEYSLDSGRNFNKVDWQSSHSFVIDQEGDYTNKIIVKITDKAGNTSNVSSLYTVKINKSGGSLCKFSQIDDDTKIWVEAPEGVLPEGSILKVEEHKEDSESYKAVNQDLDDDIKQIAQRQKLFEIHIKDLNDNIIQPNIAYGLITVKIPVPNNFDKNDLEVYRVENNLPDDEFNESVVDINNQYYCEFKTDHLSSYALIDKDTDKINKKSSNNFSLISLLITLVLIVLLVFALFISIKKYKK